MGSSLSCLLFLKEKLEIIGEKRFYITSSLKETKMEISKVAITGASGHIGNTLINGLSKNYNLLLYDKISKGKIEGIDFSDKKQIRNLFKGVDTVIHLAADSIPKASWESVLKNNIISTYNVFEQARIVGVKKIIFASSSHVIYSPEILKRKTKIKVGESPNPDSFYGVSKLFGENLGKYYSREFGIKFIALRIGWTFPEDTPLIFKETKDEDYIRAMFLSKRDCVEIFTKSLESNENYVIAYAISNNKQAVFDLKETKEILGCNLKDNAENYFKHNL